MSEEKLRKLNILISYPVKWSTHAVMRDFIQNFFDSVGSERFGCDFSYLYDKGSLSLMAESSFDIDWLCFLGTSTKRDSWNHAGRFGEGFKIASLVAYRDLGYKIEMESKDWRLEVTEADEIIECKPVKCLAYRITTRINDGISKLTLKKVSEEDYSCFVNCLNDFFYPDNPYVGNCVACHEGYGIYEIRDLSAGRLYANYQYRYSIPGFRYLITNPHYNPRKDDRERQMYGLGDANNCVLSVVERLNPNESFEFLIGLRKFWTVNRKRDILDFEEIVMILVDKVSQSDALASKFCDLYGESLSANFDRWIGYSRKRAAMHWYSNWNGRNNRVIVLNIFSKLGVLKLDELCEREGGFLTVRRPTETEIKYIDILKRLSKEFFDDLISYDELPDVDVIINKSVSTLGLAGVRPSSCKTMNVYGLRVKMIVLKIEIREELLKKDSFSGAVSTYLHELLHQYGKDSDKSFQTALMIMNKILFEIRSELELYEREWSEVG